MLLSPRSVAFPRIVACVVCDFARDESKGKLTLAGFSGVTPNVTLYIDNFAKPVALTFVLHGERGPGRGMLAFEFSSEASGAPIAATNPQVADVPSDKHFLAVFGAALLIPQPGRYRLKAFVDHAEAFSTTIDLVQGPLP